MHVLVIPSWYPRSCDDLAGSFFREQAIALVRRGHRIGVISPHTASLRRPLSWRNALSGERVEYDEGVITYRSFGLNIFAALPALARNYWVHRGLNLFLDYVKSHGRPDVLHAQSMFHAGFLALAIHREFQIPFLVTEHSSKFARGLIDHGSLAQARDVVRAAAGCFAVSRAFTQLLDRQYELGAGTWSVIPNSVSPAFVHCAVDHRGKEVPAEFVFCYIGRLAAKKGLHTLLRAFAMVFNGVGEVKLVLGGDGEERRSLEALARELSIEAQVDFLGPLTRQEVVHAIGSCDVFVMPSEYETFSVVLVEALALGKPVIATRCGGPESIVAPGDGLLVNPDDASALAGALRQMREDHASYKAEEIRQRCLSRFSEGVVVEMVERSLVLAIATERTE